MLYGIIRLAFWSIIFVICFLSLKKLKVIHKRRVYLISFVVAIVLCTVSYLIPAENVFITFSSPESAFRYVNSGTVNLAVDGQDTDMVIATKSDSYVYAIIPKSANRWKLGMGLDTKRIIQKISGNVMIYVYQYKNTGDYYITVLDTDGGTSEISDNKNSQFQYLSKQNSTLDKTFYTYFAYIHNFDEKYALTVNGTSILLAN